MDITIKRAIYTMKEMLLVGTLPCKVLSVFFIPKYGWLKAKPMTPECQGNDELLAF